MSSFNLRTWSTATLATFVLAACGGGGGGDDPAPPPQNPPPSAPVNAAPTANAGADQTMALPTDTISLTGTATDDNLPTGASLTYAWEFVTGPNGPNNAPGAVIASTTSATTNVRFSGGPGDYTFNLRASDGALTSGPDSVRVTVSANTYVFPTAPGSAGWATATLADAKMTEAKLIEARDYSTTSALGEAEAGFIVRGGKLVYQWATAGATVDTKFEMKSTSKSVGGLALFLALDEGKLALSDKAKDRLPSFGTAPDVTVEAGALADITLLQLATHTSGLSKSDDSSDPTEPLKLRFAPGTRFSYSDQGLNWLADVLTQTYAQDLRALMFARVYDTLGIRLTTDLTWRDNAFRVPNLGGVPRRELASGINASVNAMARIGVLMLNKGVWGNTQILSNSIVARAHAPTAENAGLPIELEADFPSATANYGVLWWTNANHQMPNVPTDAYWAWGLHDTLIIVIPSLDLVIARAGLRGWRTQNEFWNADYAALDPFLTPIVQSITP
jgi:CubicO group peptidase (beta-lactamase class C family)